MKTRTASNPSTLVAAALIAAASFPSLSSGLDLSRLIERHYKRETSSGEGVSERASKWVGGLIDSLPNWQGQMKEGGNDGYRLFWENEKVLTE